MSITGIQGQLLEVTVNGCSYLKDTQWISRQDPYVLLEYGSTKFSTRTCTDGDKTPMFQEKFVFVLIEGLREISVSVWNSNTLKSDKFIGSGKIQLQKVLSEGYDDTAWPLQTTAGRNAGELRSILHYSNALKPTTSFASPAPPCASEAPPTAQVPLYFKLPSTNAAPYATSAYSTPSAPYFPFSASPYPSTYPSPPYLPTPAPATPNYPPPVYPPNSTGYQPSLYSAPPPATYPPPPYPPTSVYPPPPYPAYPPPPNTYPPPPYPQTSAYPPPPYPPPQ